MLNEIRKDTTEEHCHYKQGVMGAEKLGTRPSYFGSCMLVCCISRLGTEARENGAAFLLKLLPKLAHHGVREVLVPAQGRKGARVWGKMG